jgi:hypothetical protein
MLLTTIITEALKDELGHYSLTRVAELLGYVTATVVVLKLTWMGGLTSEYFLIYLSTVATRGGLNKFIESKYRKAD